MKTPKISKERGRPVKEWRSDNPAAMPPRSAPVIQKENKMQGEPLEQHLRNAKNWLNDGQCCGQKDNSGTCAAPACIFGEALKWFHAAADEIDRQAAMRHAAEAAQAQAVKDDPVIAALELAGDFIQREFDMRTESAIDEHDEYIAEPMRLCETIAAAIRARQNGGEG